MRQSHANVVILLLGVLSAACGGESDTEVGRQTPYDGNFTVVVGDPAQTREFATPDGNDCIEVAGGGCVTPQDECGDRGTADVIVDENGNVLDIICYGQDVRVASVPTNVVDSVEAGNNTVLVLDGTDDGDDVTGDVTITGNNAIVYGQGPDTSVIGGDLVIEKNNAIVRGVRIRGDVNIVLNNTKLLFCVIEGDLTISQNDTTVAACDVFGKVTITHNNTVLVQDRFNGIDQLSAQNLDCNSNERFDDENGNLVVEDGEIAGPLTCENRP